MASRSSAGGRGDAVFSVSPGDGRGGQGEGLELGGGNVWRDDGFGHVVRIPWRACVCTHMYQPPPPHMRVVVCHKMCFIYIQYLCTTHMYRESNVVCSLRLHLQQ